MNSAESESRGLMRELKTQILVMGSIVALFWGLELVDSLILNGFLDRFGVRPGSPSGWVGIAFAPFLHGGFRHLISNTTPFIVLGGLIMAEDLSEWVVVSIVCAIASGLGTWVFGQPGTVHIGASGVIFGYFGFLLTRAYFDRRMRSVLMSVLVIALFGSMIWGILPVRIGISWEGHLFGLLGGIVSAWIVVKLNKVTS